MLHRGQPSSFTEWREQARVFLSRRVEPGCIEWLDARAPEQTLDFGSQTASASMDAGAPAKAICVPNAFLELAVRVACHASPSKWGLLYRALWRIAILGDRHLLEKPTDPDARELRLMEKAVSRERHKMTAFARFRKVDTDTSGRERYVAWYEPEHRALRLAAPFFRDRFASMDWSILTPQECAHWDGRELRFTPGVPREQAPAEDDLEAYWKTYYASIFNPARLNLRMMEREMPRRYWRNLPEAELIAELAQSAYGRVGRMRAAELDRQRPRPKGAPDGREYVSCATPEQIRLVAEGADLPTLRELASRCQACSLCERATQTVWGEGPAGARLMIVGEQPGDQEDLAGRPFVGPAGALLDRALGQAGIAREAAYVTNAVKHFKWKPDGKRRLHQSPSVAELKACAPWLEAERAAVKPAVIACLGATAARAVLGRAVAVERERGLIDDPALPFPVVVTYHPSYLLRVREASRREQAYREFSDDLRLAARYG